PLQDDVGQEVKDELPLILHSLQERSEQRLGGLPELPKDGADLASGERLDGSLSSSLEVGQDTLRAETIEGIRDQLVERPVRVVLQLPTRLLARDELKHR